MNYKMGYLILHYKVIEQTINCIDSIKKNAVRGILPDQTNEVESFIIVVDNGSGNGTGQDLLDIYKDDGEVTVILSEQNLGFAKGNNLGFVYAKEKLGCNFICMMNNDTELLQKDFFNILLEEYKDSQAAVIGPKIILNDGKYQPIYKKPVTIEGIQADITFMQKQLLYDRLHIRKLLTSVIRTINRIKNKSKNTNQETENDGDMNMRQEMIVLHGSCLIFTPVYIERFDGLNDATFMFREEEFLYVRLVEHHMLSVYQPRLEIRHYEDVATDSVFTKSSDKLKFQYKNDIESSKKLIEELKRIG